MVILHLLHLHLYLGFSNDGDFIIKGFHEVNLAIFSEFLSVLLQRKALKF